VTAGCSIAANSDVLLGVNTLVNLAKLKGREGTEIAIQGTTKPEGFQSQQQTAVAGLAGYMEGGRHCQDQHVHIIQNASNRVHEGSKPQMGRPGILHVPVVAGATKPCGRQMQ
jgi:hypothetical protein